MMPVESDEDGEEIKSAQEPIVPDDELERFDLEDFTVPGIIRKILKTTKLREVVQVRTTRKDKLSTHFEEDNKCFRKELLLSFEKECVITFALIGFEQKDFIFKLPISEKVVRFTHMKEIATKFFKVSIIVCNIIKLGNYKKAKKMYGRINQYFRSKDAKNNFSKEDENTVDFRNGKDELEAISKVVLSNICVIHLKNKEWKDVIKFADDVFQMLMNFIVSCCRSQIRQGSILKRKSFNGAH